MEEILSCQKKTVAAPFESHQHSWHAFETDHTREVDLESAVFFRPSHFPWCLLEAVALVSITAQYTLVRRLDGVLDLCVCANVITTFFSCNWGTSSRLRGDPGSLPAHKELDEPFPCMILDEDNDLLLMLLKK
jgi:hypothetical protein